MGFKRFNNKTFDKLGQFTMMSQPIRLILVHWFASKVDQICIDYGKITSFFENFLFPPLEQNRTLF